MEHRNIKVAEKLVKDMLVKVMKNEYPLEKFILSKQLRDDYKNPGQIAHRVLADRMEERDAGNKPQVGDRLSYVYVAENAAKGRQGDRIETVEYVRANKLHVDTSFYISHQIQNPVAQLFALVIEDLDGYTKRDYNAFYEEYRETLDEEEATLKVLKMKEKDLDRLLFLGSPELSKIVKKIGHSLVRGPMDMFVRK
jgi:DNA polymerase elongation subunit (family B)